MLIRYCDDGGDRHMRSIAGPCLFCRVEPTTPAKCVCGCGRSVLLLPNENGAVCKPCCDAHEAARLLPEDEVTP